MQKGTVYNFYKDMPGWAKGVSVLIVLAIGVVTYFSVRKWIKNRPPKVDYPNNGKGIPEGWDARPLALYAYGSMKGLNITSASIALREDALTKILQLPTDDMFAALYDTFNQMYMKEGGGTLKNWIQEETGVGAFGGGLKEKLMARFNKLGLK